MHAAAATLRRMNAGRIAHAPRGARWQSPLRPPPFKKLMAANRGEIALRILRASDEMGIRTVGIFSHEDRYALHRTKADQSFMLDRTKTAVAQYLDIPTIVSIASANGVDAVHPGYGFLSENADFAQACSDAGLTFVGPTVENLRTFADKTTARSLAIRCGVPVVPGSDGPVQTVADAKAFARAAGYPVIIKAAMGGGGRGMRVARTEEELEREFGVARAEAEKAFGDGTVFLEKYVLNPRHIEVQVLGDAEGNVIHLFERDCSVQRRHQKVVEIAPAKDLPDAIRSVLLQDAVRLAQSAGYRNAGTVEFLLGEDGSHYFIEVNPRLQVEHTVTEEVTGVDIVQSQIHIAGGATLADLGLGQDRIRTNGYAVQCRITTEDPSKNFQPDHGTLEVYRVATGAGIRLDGIGTVGASILPHYDSLLVKVTGKAGTYEAAVRKLQRALREYRIRGVKTNIPFLLKLLSHPQFASGAVNTSFIEKNPDLLRVSTGGRNRAQRLLYYLGELVVNGPPSSLGATGAPPATLDPTIPKPSREVRQEHGWRDVLKREGPEAFARAVREHNGTLLMDTTWRDAHQSLLNTRLRTRDLASIAPATADVMSNLYALECWGGATLDVALRFLHECPWERLARLRELVPNVPFQMLLRGANAVGYTSYPDNVLFKFCDVAVRTGMDVFRVFDSLNYLPNMQIGMDAAGAAGGVVEAAICYTGDVSDPRRTKYSLDYYLDYARQLVAHGCHVLAIKDMAGLLKPDAAAALVGALRAEFPDMPIHVHTHDSSGTGVASMIASAHAGADVVDVAIDSMSGTTSQPAMGAVVAALQGTKLDAGVELGRLGQLHDAWEEIRGLYAPFESNQRSTSADIYDNEMPGGQYTALLFQSTQLGLSGRWPAIKRAYAAANRLLGDIVKVTPSSKVVGDLAQFMVQNGLTEEDVVRRAEELSFPQSVVEYFQGYLGIPYGGFPEPLRSRVLKGKLLPNGKQTFEGRPGEEMDPLDFEAYRAGLEVKHGHGISDQDLMSSVMFPKVFDEYEQFKREFGDVSVIPTRPFLAPMKVGEEIAFDLEPGKTLFVKLRLVGPVDEQGMREVVFELNGETRALRIHDTKSGVAVVQREKADSSKEAHMGAPMPGSVVEVRVKPGERVAKGQALAVLSAMKMDTVVYASRDGVVGRVLAAAGDTLAGGDLLLEIDEVKPE